MFTTHRININKFNFDKNLYTELPLYYKNKINKTNSNQIIATYYLIKKYVMKNSKHKISFNKYGKPYIKDSINFNISHSGDYVIIALSNKNEIGVDIERIKKIKYYNRISNKFFTKEECDYINNDINKFYKIWTRKESFYKCIGTGFNKYDKNLSIIKNNITYKNKKYIIKTKKINDYYISTTILINN